MHACYCVPDYWAETTDATLRSSRATSLRNTNPSGLLQLGARFYWPQIGRFIQQDPIGNGINWYAYSSSNPIVGIDPSAGIWYNPLTWGNKSDPNGGSGGSSGAGSGGGFSGGGGSVESEGI